MKRCPICGADDLRRLPYPGRAQALQLEAILVCGRCGSGSAAPAPDQQTLDRFYATGAYWHASEGKAQRAHERAQAWLRVEKVRAFAPRRSLAVADIGAGRGAIARALAALGVDVSHYVFVEPDEQAAAEARALSLPFAVERAAALGDLRGPFDLVFLNHVLEHVAEPLLFLREAAGFLSPDGIAYVETPYADYRFKDDVFPHVFFFTPRSLVLLGQHLGARTLACDSFGRMPAPRWTPVGLVQRLAARLLPWVRSAWLQRLLDRVIWRYAPCDDGIWLRWVFSAGQARHASGMKAR
jgi:2-polyprenyl-3-methyl-5-hydroxy-6-metoxy-1,4-benzoquinol methylase